MASSWGSGVCRLRILAIDAIVRSTCRTSPRSNLPMTAYGQLRHDNPPGLGGAAYEAENAEVPRSREHRGPDPPSQMLSVNQ